MWVWIAIAASVVLGALGQVLMKIAMKSVGPFPGLESLSVVFKYYLDAALSWPMIGAVFSYGSSFLIWLGVLSRVDLSLARPFVSFGYVIVILYGFFAGERMTWDRLLGILLIMAGIFFVARSGIKI